MSTILVGMFDSHAEAEAARSKLMGAGFAASALALAGGSATSTASASGAVEPQHESGIAHFFKNLFGGDDDASGDPHGETYREAFRRGSHGLSVTAQTDAEADKAEQILDECGAVDFDARSEQWRADGWKGAALPERAAATGDAPTLKVIDEELKVGKRTVSRGGVRIFSRLVEVPVEETVTLREERAEVQRRPVDRPATEADFAAFKEGRVEVRESTEEAVVSKSARVVAEVEIGKEVTQRQETVHDTVRQTRVDVERLDDGAARTAAVAASVAGTAVGTGTASFGATGAGSPNLDPITGEPGAHPVGTALGATAGGVAAGAAVGTVAGPLGTIVGAAAGAVVGGLAGKGVSEKVDPTVPTKR